MDDAEINRLVAEKVMGWTVEKGNRYWYIYGPIGDPMRTGRATAQSA